MNKNFARQWATTDFKKLAQNHDIFTDLYWEKEQLYWEKEQQKKIASMTLPHFGLLSWMVDCELDFFKKPSDELKSHFILWLRSCRGQCDKCRKPVSLGTTPVCKDSLPRLKERVFCVRLHALCSSAPEYTLVCEDVVERCMLMRPYPTFVRLWRTLCQPEKLAFPKLRWARDTANNDFFAAIDLWAWGKRCEYDPDPETFPE